MPNIDLHSHSIASDGLLSPRELVLRAAQHGVDVLALTDHDTVAGLDEARAAAQEAGIKLVAGVEISVTWNGTTVHVVGLNIDPHHPILQQGLAGVRSGRVERAQRIGAELARHGIKGGFEGASALAANKEMVGRSHFARFMVEAGHARNVAAVFKRYLVKGKPGYVSHPWVELAQAIAWIHASGGVSVLAHPGRYRVSETGTRSLLEEFKRAGGMALEVVCASHTPELTARFARLATEYGLLASRGSDFHGPGESWVEPGRIPGLPVGCKPVWEGASWV